MGFLGVVIGLIVLVLIFIICREIFCWYWKINEITDLLRSINDKLSEESFKNQNTVEKTAVEPVKETVKQESEEEKQERELKDLRSRIKSYDDLMNDPKIKEEAETMQRFYGKDAYEHYLQKKAKELGLEN